MTGVPGAARARQGGNGGTPAEAGEGADRQADEDAVVAGIGVADVRLHAHDELGLRDVVRQAGEAMAKQRVAGHHVEAFPERITGKGGDHAGALRRRLGGQDEVIRQARGDGRVRRTEQMILHDDQEGAGPPLAAGVGGGADDDVGADRERAAGRRRANHRANLAGGLDLVVGLGAVRADEDRLIRRAHDDDGQRDGLHRDVEAAGGGVAERINRRAGHGVDSQREDGAGRRRATHRGQLSAGAARGRRGVIDGHARRADVGRPVARAGDVHATVAAGRAGDFRAQAGDTGAVVGDAEGERVPARHEARGDAHRIPSQETKARGQDVRGGRAVQENLAGVVRRPAAGDRGLIGRAEEEAVGIDEDTAGRTLEAGTGADPFRDGGVGQPAWMNRRRHIRTRRGEERSAGLELHIL